MNTNPQFALNQLQNFTNSQQSLTSRLLSYTSSSSSASSSVSSSGSSSVSASSSVNGGSVSVSTTTAPVSVSNLAMKANALASAKTPQIGMQQQQQKNNLFDNFSLNPNFANNFTNLSYSLNLQQQQQVMQQQQQQHIYAQAQVQAQQQKMGAVANSLLVGLSQAASVGNSGGLSGGNTNSSTCNLNNTLFVGNLHASLQEIDLIQVFRPFGRIVECCKKWLHFGFVKFTTEEEACHAYVTLNGFRLKGRPMRLEFQNRTKKARIKAILAQAALQAATSAYPLNTDLSSLGSLGSLSGGGGGTSVGLNYSNLHLSQNSNQQQSHHLNGGNNNQHHHNHLQSDEANHQLNLQLKQASLFSQQQQDAATYAAFYANSAETNSSSIASLTASAADQFDSQINSFFNPDELIKFAKGDSPVVVVPPTSKQQINLDIGQKQQQKHQQQQHHQPHSSEIQLTLTKKSLSPSSAHYSDCLSVSSDSGCRSASFLGNENECASAAADSAIASLKSIDHFTRHIKLKESELKQRGLLKSETDISEHCEFTCSNSSPLKSKKRQSCSANNSMVLNLVDIERDALAQEEREEGGAATDNDEDDEDEDLVSNCDTSDDASEIPTDSDCLNDLDLIEDFQISSSGASSDNSFAAVVADTTNQVQNTTSSSKSAAKLDLGIYRSINQTLSLFIQPQDVLKQMDASEFDEYNLFPNEEYDNNNNAGEQDNEMTQDSYLLSKQHPFYLF